MMCHAGSNSCYTDPLYRGVICAIGATMHALSLESDPGRDPGREKRIGGSSARSFARAPRA